LAEKQYTYAGKQECRTKKGVGRQEKAVQRNEVTPPKTCA